MKKILLTLTLIAGLYAGDYDFACKTYLKRYIYDMKLASAHMRAHPNYGENGYICDESLKMIYEAMLDDVAKAIEFCENNKDLEESLEKDFEKLKDTIKNCK